eukprot:g10528.t1
MKPWFCLRLEHTIRELRRLPYRPLESLRISRERFCLHPFVQQAQDKSTACEMATMTRHGNALGGGMSGCVHLDNAEAIGYPTIAEHRAKFEAGGTLAVYDIEDLVLMEEDNASGRSQGQLHLLAPPPARWARKRGCPGVRSGTAAEDTQTCPYHASMDLTGEGAALILCTYPQIMDPCESSNFEQVLQDAVVVIDEAHNLPQVARDSASFRGSVQLISKLQGLAKATAEPEAVELAEKVCGAVTRLRDTWSASDPPSAATHFLPIMKCMDRERRLSIANRFSLHRRPSVDRRRDSEESQQEDDLEHRSSLPMGRRHSHRSRKGPAPQAWGEGWENLLAPHWQLSQVVVKNFLLEVESTILRAWLKIFDPEYKFHITSDVFCMGMEKSGYAGDVYLLFQRLDTDNSGKLTLDEIDEDTAKLWLTFKQWCVTTFESPLDMEEDFKLRCRLFDWRDGQEDLLWKGVALHGEEYVRPEMLKWMAVGKEEHREKEELKKLAMKVYAAKIRERQQLAQALPQFKAFLKKKCGGSLLAAWRRHLDRHASMSVHKYEMAKAAKALCWPGEFRILWKALDKDPSTAGLETTEQAAWKTEVEDKSGLISYQELDMQGAEVLAEFKSFCSKFGSAVDAFHTMDKARNNSGRLSERDFIEECQRNGFSATRALFRGLDFSASGSITQDEIVFLDQWVCPSYLTAPKNEAAAQEFRHQDPGFVGDWVHALCGSAYPVIFRVANWDPNDDTFTLNTDCPAAVLSMELEAFRSTPLHHAAVERPEDFEGDADWGATPRVVLQELWAGDCLARCDQVPRCFSIAHGPHGCHLKARCVQPGEAMVPAGEQGADYRTWYRKGCGAGAAGGTGVRHMQEMQKLGMRRFGVAWHVRRSELGAASGVENMMGMALRALEFCLHCLDASPWPFLLEEILENYALAVEAPEHFSWHRPGRVGLSAYAGPSSAAPSAPSASSSSVALPGLRAPVRLTLLRLQVRWIRGLEMEAEFWRGKLSLKEEENVSLERLKRWLATGAWFQGVALGYGGREVPWTLPGDDLCQYLAEARERHGGLGLPRILNTGSGPLAPQPLRCGPRSGEVKVVAADGLARFYLKVLDDNGMEPPFLPVQCPVEELHTCFPPAHFDVVHIRNALDHSFDPVLGIERMLHVARPGGWVLLRHARNEGVAGQFRNGLHQWAFDVEMPSGEEPHFLVRTRLQDHPSDDAPEEEKYVWVEIRKPTRHDDLPGAWRYLTAGSTYLTLHDVDPETAHRISEFQAFADQQFGSMMCAFKLFDLDRNGYVDITEFTRVLIGFGYPGSNCKALFYCLDVDGHGRLSRRNVAFIDDWARPGEETKTSQKDLKEVELSPRMLELATPRNRGRDEPKQSPREMREQRSLAGQASREWRSLGRADVILASCFVALGLRVPARNAARSGRFRQPSSVQRRAKQTDPNRTLAWEGAAVDSYHIKPAYSVEARPKDTVKTLKCVVNLELGFAEQAIQFSVEDEVLADDATLSTIDLKDPMTPRGARARGARLQMKLLEVEEDVDTWPPGDGVRLFVKEQFREKVPFLCDFPPSEYGLFLLDGTPVADSRGNLRWLKKSELLKEQETVAQNGLAGMAKLKEEIVEGTKKTSFREDLDSSSDEEDEYDYEKIRLKHDLTWSLSLRFRTLHLLQRIEDLQDQEKVKLPKLKLSKAGLQLTQAPPKKAFLKKKRSPYDLA